MSDSCELFVLRIGLTKHSLTRPRDRHGVVAPLFTRIMLLLLYLWLSIDVMEQWRAYTRQTRQRSTVMYVCCIIACVWACKNSMSHYCQWIYVLLFKRSNHRVRALTYIEERWERDLTSSGCLSPRVILLLSVKSLLCPSTYVHLGSFFQLEICICWGY